MPVTEQSAPGQRRYNHLDRRAIFNVRVGQLYRADYEARNLREVKKAKAVVAKRIADEPPNGELCSLVAGLDRLIERERVLLRIPAPKAVEKPAIELAGDTTGRPTDHTKLATIVESEPQATPAPAPAPQPSASASATRTPASTPASPLDAA